MYNNVLNFTWTASTQADGGVITYEIQVAKDNSFTQNAHMLSSTTNNKSITLKRELPIIRE